MYSTQSHMSGSQDATDAAGSTTDSPPAGFADMPPSPSSCPMLRDPDHRSSVDAMREAIRGIELDIVDLVFNNNLALPAGEARLADWLKVPLECATADGNLAVVKRLLAAGVGTKAASNGTQLGLLLHTAAASGNADVIEEVIKSGAEVGAVDRNNKSRTALHVAAECGRGEAVRAIATARGANVDWADALGWTPLHVAANAGHRGGVVFLLLKGANPHLKTHREGDSPLHLAALNNHVGVVEDLLTLGKANVGMSNNAGQTALHLAARWQRLGACIALLRGGATVGRVCSKGLSCLDHAAWNGHSGQLLRALTAGESPNDRKRRCSLALYYAAKANKVDTIRELIKLGADINTTRSGGNTNLHCMATRGADWAAHALLVTGANLESRNNDGATPLHRACSFSQPSTVELLLRWGADETATTYDNATALDLVGSAVEEEMLTPEHAATKEQLDAIIRSMLANAPADRIWRRRGWLVLCRVRWLTRVAETNQRQLATVPSLSTSSGSSSSSGTGGASDGNGNGNARCSSGKAPAGKRRKGGAGGTANARAAHSGGGKGKGQATPREKGARSGGSGASSKSSSGNGGGKAGGSTKRVDGRRGSKSMVSRTRARGVGHSNISSAGGVGVAPLGSVGSAGSAALVYCRSDVRERPELRLGRESILKEGYRTARARTSAAGVGEKGNSSFVEAVERLLLVREEGVFRDIVGFL